MLKRAITIVQKDSVIFPNELYTVKSVKNTTLFDIGQELTKSAVDNAIRHKFEVMIVGE